MTLATEKKRAVVLLSGGLDSATVLAIARSQGYELYALSFSYGQRHIFELEAAARVAASIGVADHRTAVVDLRAFGGSALTADIEVPKGRSAGEMSHGIPITYVPARRRDGQPGDEGRSGRASGVEDPHASDCDVEGGDHSRRHRTGRGLQTDQQLLRSLAER